MTHYYALAAYLADMDPDGDATQDNEDKAFEILADKYGLDDPEKFDALFNRLMPMIEKGRGVYTKKLYKGFQYNHWWLAKVRDDER